MNTQNETDYSAAYEDGHDAGYTQGYEDGHRDGFHDGRAAEAHNSAEATDLAYANGYEDGCRDGRGEATIYHTLPAISFGGLSVVCLIVAAVVIDLGVLAVLLYSLLR